MLNIFPKNADREKNQFSYLGNVTNKIRIFFVLSPFNMVCYEHPYVYVFGQK